MSGYTIPALAGSRAAITAYLAHPEGAGDISGSDLDNDVERERLIRLLGVSQSTLTRYIQEWVQHGLVLKMGRALYRIPCKPIRQLLLAEASPYHRELLLLSDVFREYRVNDSGEDRKGGVFACVPVRDALNMVIPHPVLVLPLDTDIPGPVDPGWGVPQVARMNWPRGIEVAEVPLPGGGPEARSYLRVNVLPSTWALAIFACTGDADFVAAVRDAAPRLGTRVEDVAGIVRSRKVATGPVERRFQNLLVLPGWLRPRARAANRFATREIALSLLEGQPALRG